MQADTIDRRPDGRLGVQVVVAARDEAQLIGATLSALARAFPEATLWVADDGSRDATAALAAAAGARVVGGPRVGKGGAMTRAAAAALAGLPAAGEPVFLLCDGDLGDSAERLGPLVEAVAKGAADMAVAVFCRRLGGGFGLVVGCARRAVAGCCGLAMRAPLSGQRALGRAALEAALPFAGGYGMEVGMTIDLVRTGRRVVEVELDLSHRSTGRTPAGFAHRAGQLRDVMLARSSRRRAPGAQEADGGGKLTEGA